MSLIRKHGAVLQAWACLDLVIHMETVKTEVNIRNWCQLNKNWAVHISHQHGMWYNNNTIRCQSPRSTSVCRPSPAPSWQTTWTKTHSCQWSGRTLSELPSLSEAATGQHGTLWPVYNDVINNIILSEITKKNCWANILCGRPLKSCANSALLNWKLAHCLLLSWGKFTLILVFLHRLFSTQELVQHGQTESQTCIVA